MDRLFLAMCPFCLRNIWTDSTDQLRTHREIAHGGAVDLDHLEAIREVDALTPECPPLISPEY